MWVRLCARDVCCGAQRGARRVVGPLGGHGGEGGVRHQPRQREQHRQAFLGRRAHQGHVLVGRLPRPHRRGQRERRAGAGGRGVKVLIVGGVEGLAADRRGRPAAQVRAVVLARAEQLERRQQLDMAGLHRKPAERPKRRQIVVVAHRVVARGFDGTRE
eukprot:246701-Prymnesium_polylepis.1